MIQKPVQLLNFRCVALRSSFSNNFEQKDFTRRIIIAAIFSVTLFACNHKNAPGNNDASKENNLPANDSRVFYPIHEYFITQIIKADSLSNIIYIHTDADNKKDSSIIDSIKFRELAKPFIEDDINDTAIKKYYNESVFHDATTSSNTFTYTSINSTLPLQTLDILLDTATDNVKRVFITKNFSQGDSLITEKMSWKTGQSFSINRIIQLAGNKQTTQQVTVLWNSNY
jgi:hypothetical protein